MKTILWWVGLPVRIAVAAVLLIVLALVIPRDFKETRNLAWNIVKGTP